jgi:hypothetical protein
MCLPKLPAIIDIDPAISTSGGDVGDDAKSPQGINDLASSSACAAKNSHLLSWSCLLRNRHCEILRRWIHPFASSMKLRYS